MNERRTLLLHSVRVSLVIIVTDDNTFTLKVGEIENINTDKIYFSNVNFALKTEIFIPLRSKNQAIDFLRKFL